VTEADHISREDGASLAVPFLPIERLPSCAERAAFIDLRSPSEFENDHIPGAINVPLFDDMTRAFVGLLYRQFSPEAAFQEGRATVAQGIAELVRDVARVIEWDVSTEDLAERVIAMTSGGVERMERAFEPTIVDRAPSHPVVFSCARGGLRSRSVVALMRAIGLDRAVGLEGGYRAYRSRVMTGLESWTPPRRVVSLRGLTGVGKTLVLRAIEELRPGWTLDLEGIAGHRSSLLGMVGLRPVSQKAFESGLLARAGVGYPGGVLVVEGESRKVGDVVIPARIWESMRAATNVEITASTERRVAVLSEDYLADPASRPKLREQLLTVGERMDGQPDLAGLLDRDEITELVEVLLERYYDPLYRRSEEGKEYALRVTAETAEAAAREVVGWIES